MAREARDADAFSRWIARPQSLIALSALLLSACGVFIAVYEASLVRRQQRASVWPYVEVSASLTTDRVTVRVQNTGVGPARVRAAALIQDGETREDWADLIRRAAVDPRDVSSYLSLIQGRVPPRDSEAETIFQLTGDDGAGARAVLPELRRQIFEGRIDVALCDCSVFEECWTSSLQDVLRRSSGVAATIGDRAVDGCDGAAHSAI